MKKLLIYLILLIHIPREVRAQDQVNLKKYWYYRHRLLNNFMVKGDCQGCSEIMNERDHEAANDPISHSYHIAKWGDESFNLGEYISVLATEFNLLYNAGQPVDTTLQELYYAFRAFNRMDLTAESSYGTATGRPHTQTAGDLNGFFIRDDVPGNFLDLHPQLKQGFTRSVDSVESDYSYAFRQAPNYGSIPSDKNFLMSHDQVWPLLMGLSLVREYVWPGVSYHGQHLNAVNTNADFNSEAEAIIERIMANFRHANPIRDWSIVNPITGDWDDLQGFQLNEFSYGVAEAACFIKHGNQPYNPLVYPVHTCDDFHDLYTLDPIHANGWKGLGTIGYPYVTSYEDYKVEMIAAIGNSWYTKMYPTAPTPSSILTTIFSLSWPPHWEDVVTVVMSAIGLPTNNTAVILYPRTNYRKYPYIAQLRQILHGGANFFPPSTYQNLINSAPCAGPLNFSYSGGPMSTYDWSSRDRLHESDELGGGVNGSSQGEYHGLDYMLYYNLYTIQFGTGIGTAYIDYMDRRITYPFPVVAGSTSFGSYSNPTTVEAFNSIDANNIINANADVDYRAGTEIHLGAGFHAISGCDFHAYIDPFECASDGDYRLASTGSDSSTDEMTTAVAYAGQTTFVNYPPAKTREDNMNDTPETEQETIQTVASPSTNNSIANTSETSLIRIQPNPTNGSFEVVFLGKEKPAGKLTLFNIFGTVIAQEQITGTITTFDLSSQSKGLYYLKIETGQKSNVEKIIYQ